MESETSIIQQPQQQQQQQQQKQQQQQQQQQQQRRPESVLASEAEKRASTSHGGRPETRESTNLNHAQGNNHRPQSKPTNEVLRSRPTSRDIITNGNNAMKTPHTTPRDPNSTNEEDSVQHFLRSIGDAAVPGKEEVGDSFENVLDEDELFMALSPQDKEEWHKMMADREQQLVDSKEKHQSWSDSFTRRRMFAYSRMRKLNLSYQDRLKLFSNISDTINHVISRKMSAENNNFSKKKAMTKRMSEPILESKDEPSTAAATTTRSANQTMKHSQSTGGLQTKTEPSNANVNSSNPERESLGLNMDSSGRQSTKEVVCTVEQVT